MSFGWTAATWLAVGSLAVGAYGAYSGAQNAKAANQQAKDNALATAKQADQANNRANAKSPDSAAMMAANILAGKAGQSGTMLTGPTGVDPTTLTLGKSSLLGG